MVEVFSTNVREKAIADFLVSQIEQQFRNCRANFDLEDCDHVLRIKSTDGTLNIDSVRDFITGFGYRIDVLPDTIIPLSRFPVRATGSLTEVSGRILSPINSS